MRYSAPRGFAPVSAEPLGERKMAMGSKTARVLAALAATVLVATAAFHATATALWRIPLRHPRSALLPESTPGNLAVLFLASRRACYRLGLGVALRCRLGATARHIHRRTGLCRHTLRPLACRSLRGNVAWPAPPSVSSSQVFGGRSTSAVAVDANPHRLSRSLLRCALLESPGAINAPVARRSAHPS